MKPFILAWVDSALLAVFSSRSMAQNWLLISLWISCFNILYGISNILLQVLLAFIGCVVGTSYGMSSGHSAVLLPHLQSENSTLQIDTDTGSWIGKSQQQLLLAKWGFVFSQHTQTCSNSSTIAADSSNGVTNTRCCRYSCMRSWSTTRNMSSSFQI
jgi:hypothetical protein